MIKLDSSGPIFYLSERVGKDGNTFYLYKFRTMLDKERQTNVQVFADSPEVTRIGKILRRLKIDELPQLLNVLRGDLSLIGPRPCLKSLLGKMDENSKVRFDVRPGMTGLAQVNGNIHIEWEERWAYDVEYVNNLKLILDLKILFKTIAIVLLGEEKFVKKPNNKK